MMFKIFLYMVIQLGTIACSRAGVADTPKFDVRGTIAELVHSLCPSVDICNVNATSAEVTPNKLVRQRRVSCCKGCSCHPDCKEKDNCCFPDDYKSNSEVQPANKLTECLYTRLGQPEMLNGLVPAYKTIVAKPEGGCTDTTPIKISPTVVLNPTCDDIDVTPLGPYFPVFSRDIGTIYKNILCARCHGILNTESFSANLTCRHSKAQTKERNSITEILQFLETGSLSPECHVDFTITDMSVLEDNRCFINVVDTCTSQAVSSTIGIYSPKVDFATIHSLCESGFNSPTVDSETGVVYKNAFCSLCGTNKGNVVFLMCSRDGDRTTSDKTLTLLLNTKIMYSINKSPDLNTKKEICSARKGTDQNSKHQKICKTIYCPTGKIRNEDGDCELIGNYLAKSRGIVNIKLTPTEKIMLGNESQKAFNERLVQSLIENNPWPAQWGVYMILSKTNFTECDGNILAEIKLAWNNRATRNIYEDIENSIRIPWIFEWMAKTYTLAQSIFEYKLVWKPGVPSIYLPSWQLSLITDPETGNIFDCGVIRWKMLFRNRSEEREDLLFTKLFLCDQIQLRLGEFILSPDKSYLESNLTSRILHDLEFDIFEDKDGPSARVCLHDTILADKRTNKGTSLERQAINIILISELVIFLITFV